LIYFATFCVELRESRLLKKFANWPVGPLRVPDWTMAAGAYIL
jgi:hypothetical protein